jgi:predicted ester cyclase
LDPNNGIKEASKYWDELFEAFPDIKINPVTITTDNRKNRVLTEMEISGAQKGKVGSTPGFGKKFRIRGVYVYDFMYKIKEIRMYYDSSILKRQLNILKT